MNEPDDRGAEAYELPEILITPDPPAPAAVEPPGDGAPSTEVPPEEPPPEQPPVEEPPIERHDPFAYKIGKTGMFTSAAADDPSRSKR